MKLQLLETVHIAVVKKTAEGSYQCRLFFSDFCDRSSDSMAVTFNPAFSSCGSTGRDLSTDSVTSLISTSTGNSMSPPSTWRLPAVPASTSSQAYTASQGQCNVNSLQRPHSVNGPFFVLIFLIFIAFLSKKNKRILVSSSSLNFLLVFLLFVDYSS
jgi:hypothetical protein